MQSIKNPDDSMNIETINDIDNFFAKSLKSVKSAKPRIGWTCSYTPEELILAGGFLPSRITGSQKSYKAEGYFPTNFCPFVKSIWGDILNNRDEYKAVIFTNSCDGMRRLYDICSTYDKKTPFFMLDVPRVRSKEALGHFEFNLSRMLEFIINIKNKKDGDSKTGITGIINSSGIKNSIEIINKKKMLLKELSGYHKSKIQLLKTNSYFKIMKISVISDLEIFNEELENYNQLLNSLMEKIKEKAKINKNGEIRTLKTLPGIMIIGNFINEDSLWEILSDLNCRISADDLCNTGRYYENKVEVTGHKNEIGAIAFRYLNKPQCMRMANLDLKLEEINKAIEENFIKGVIFLSQKFCDNTLLFYPLLRQNLTEKGIPSLFIEIEHNNLSSGQIKTRIEAFLEMIL